MSKDEALRLCNHVRCCYCKPDGYMYQYGDLMVDVWSKVLEPYDYDTAHSALVGLIHVMKDEPTIEDLVIAITKKNISPFE